MRQSQDLQVSESVNELLNVLPKRVRAVNKPKGYTSYLDITATFDIETTNTETDGFAYTFQACFGGKCVLLRYWEDFALLLDCLTDRWNTSNKKRLIVYVHNLSYEYYYLGQLMAAKWGEPKALYTKNNKPLYMQFSNGLEFRDSLKLFQKSLARATEGVKHPKLAGDLDYNVYRTPDTPLTQEEFEYCVNDVIGLYEAIERMKAERGYNAATIPMTQTAMVIDDINKAVRPDRRCVRAMSALWLNHDQVKIAYNAMAGGDTHGSRFKAGKTFYGCNSYDFKSAHPSQQLLQKFPCGAPWDLDPDTPEEELSALLRHDCGWIAKVMIYDFHIKPDCPNPTISLSKVDGVVEELEGLDNGRVLGGLGAMVYMDSNDYQRFREAYDYSGLVAVEGFGFRLAYLPKSFRRPIIEAFVIKESMKGSPDYMWSKAKLNSIFGACAQKTVRDEYLAKLRKDGIINDHYSWLEKLDGVPESRQAMHEGITGECLYMDAMTDEKTRETQAKKFPFLWGLWTSSLTRLCLWRLQKLVGWDRLIYWDTDSVKYIGDKVPAVEEYNDAVKAQCERMGCVVSKGDKNVYIGVAEDEHPSIRYGYKSFRFLHAKCYADEGYNPATGEYELESTIAGVGKREGVAALQGNVDNLNTSLYIADAGGRMLEYHNAPIRERHDFERTTVTASFIRMLPRVYDMRNWREKAAEIEEFALT